jgi:hypothetical protein
LHWWKGLLNRYRGENLYRGFESLPLRLESPMRSWLALGLVAAVACTGESTTSPAQQTISEATGSPSTALPSVNDPSVQPLFVCGPSYPSDGGVIAGWCNTVQVLWLQPHGKDQWSFTIRVPGSDAPPPVASGQDFIDHVFGVYNSPEPLIRHDGIYHFEALDIEVVGGRRYLEVSVRNNEPVNWGVFQTR